MIAESTRSLSSSSVSYSIFNPMTTSFFKNVKFRKQPQAIPFSIALDLSLIKLPLGNLFIRPSILSGVPRRVYLLQSSPNKFSNATSRRCFVCKYKFVLSFARPTFVLSRMQMPLMKRSIITGWAFSVTKVNVDRSARRFVDKGATVGTRPSKATEGRSESLESLLDFGRRPAYGFLNTSPTML